MQTVTVPLGARSYSIAIGAGLLDDRARWREVVGSRRVLIVTDEIVADRYLDRLAETLGGGDIARCVLPAGEAHKTLETAGRIWDRLMDARLARDDLLIALGGGVVGDIAGFAAACYQRGIDCVQVPTTLIAQVDSAVGGKTGVNHPLGKNMIGAFHQPAAVIADIGTLATLPAAEYRAGLAEIIKYGVIADAEFFAWLEIHLDALLEQDEAALAHAVARSCEIKATIVAADEHERGRRALLNLGHTFGHAIETGLGHGQWRHGEAVAAGMVMAAEFATRLGWIENGDVMRLRDWLIHAGLPTWAPAELEVERLLDLMAGDKKVRGGRLRLVLPRGIGNAEVTGEFDHAALGRMLIEGPPGA
ncbi:MAG TPA: 3-dehydroquinate synthase [Gammaproteobacteria bacterium]|nr:3-dehydroquinate synthase [Gammaproteobacteria bacterium]